VAKNTIYVQGLPELEKKLRKLSDPDLLMVPLQKTVLRAYEDTQDYPKASRRPFRWKSRKQRAYVMAAIRKGKIKVPYERRKGVGGLASSWVARIERRGSRLVGIVASNKDYGPYVMGKDEQADYHKGTWPTIDKIKEKHEKRYQKECIEHVRSILNG
jgi:hypothetical protein